MSRPAARIGWALAAVSSLLGVGGLLLVLRLRGVPLPVGPAVSEGDVVFAVGMVFLAVVFPAVGALIAARHPRNPIGWMLVAFGLMQALTGGLMYARWALFVASVPVPFAAGATWLSSWIWAPSLALLATFLPLLLPTGRLPSPRWRPVAWLAATATAAAVMAVAVRLWPLRGVGLLEPAIDLGGAEAVFNAGLAVMAACTVAALASLAARWRRAGPDERQQLKWVGFGAGIAAVGVVVAFVDPLWDTLALAVIFVTLLALPVSIGVAVLRYRLYDVDRIISRTLAYAGVSAILTALYVAGVVVIGALLSPLAQGSQLPVAGSTLAVAAAFGPLRRRVQAVVDRRFNRARYDAARTIDDFAAGLRESTRMEHLHGRLLEVVDRTLEPAHASVWLRDWRWRA
jgi:hypothetical protein